MIRSRSLRGHVSRRGMILAQVAISLVAILSVAALTMDGGLMMTERRHTQASADAAALAAADDLFLNYQTNQGLDTGGTARAAAISSAAGNGFNNDGTHSIITVRVPGQAPVQSSPTIVNGGGQLLPGYVEVIIQYNQPRGFSGIFGSASLPVKARGVARGVWGASNAGVLMLGSGAGALSLGNAGVQPARANGESTMNGATTAKLTVGGGGTVQVNSTDPNAVQNPGLITGTSHINVAGPGTNTATTTYNSPPAANPLAYLPTPSKSSLTVQSTSQLSISSGTVTLNPGVYTGGISITGTAQVTMNPGIYYLDGGGFYIATTQDVNNLVALQGAGVMIYNAPKTSTDVINFSNLNVGEVQISPPTSGIYQGMVIMQDPTSTNTVYLTSDEDVRVSGTIYAPKAPVIFEGFWDENGEVGSSHASQIIASSLYVRGAGDMMINYSSSQVARVRMVQLVE